MLNLRDGVFRVLCKTSFHQIKRFITRQKSKFLILSGKTTLGRPPSSMCFTAWVVQNCKQDLLCFFFLIKECFPSSIKARVVECMISSCPVNSLSHLSHGFLQILQSYHGATCQIV
ncbi:hypothetical protein CHARACLAT_006416 [Characodon lateralis]|uniref:Uncharacterized protein n=1 Tax=Characodon lateralis TaxID=208331 RepID=A0ABU7E7K2_9TELE|nr:hypothetical protein [Characodon lateralis]